MVIMNLLSTYNIVSVGYICPMNILQCTATQCMCYKDIQIMEEGTFKGKKIYFHHTVLKVFSTYQQYKDCTKV